MFERRYDIATNYSISERAVVLALASATKGD